MAKVCSHQNCMYGVFSCGLCQLHWRNANAGRYQKKMQESRQKWHLKQTDQEPPKPFKVKYETKAIKKISTRQQKLNAAYSAQRKVFFHGHPYCEAMIYEDAENMCTGFATDVHHKKGRGEYILDERTWLAVCRNCHHFIETHPEWAKEKGFSLSRLEVGV